MCGNVGRPTALLQKKKYLKNYWMDYHCTNINGPLRMNRYECYESVTFPLASAAGQSFNYSVKHLKIDGLQIPT